MKKHNLLIIFLLLFSFTVKAQSLKHSTKSTHTTICGIVNESDQGRVSIDEPLILYMQDSAMGKQIEIVFTKNMREKMSFDPYLKMVNQSVCITGRITSYNNAPAMIITNEKEIKTKDKQQVDNPTPSN